MHNKIQIKYDELEDIARKVGKSVTRVEDLLTKARLCMTMMDDGAWIGRGSDKYRAEMEGRAVPGLRKLLAALSDLHYGFLRAGDIFHEAEQEAARRIERFESINIPTGVLGGGGTIGGNPDLTTGGGGNPPNTSGGLGGNPNVTIPIPGGGSGGNSDFNFPTSGGGLGGNSNGTSIDPRIFDIFPIGSDGGSIPRPDWYTEYSEDIDGFNGAVDGAVLLIDGGNTPAGHAGEIVNESAAGGGVPVSGMLVQNLTEPRQAERAASAVGGFLANNPNAQIKLSPGMQALINGVATDSLGRSLMTMPTQEQIEALRRFVEVLRTTVEAFGRVLPGL